MLLAERRRAPCGEESWDGTFGAAGMLLGASRSERALMRILYRLLMGKFSSSIVVMTGGVEKKRSSIVRLTRETVVKY